MIYRLCSSVYAIINKPSGVKYDSSNPGPSEKSNVPVENSNTFYRVVCGSFNNRIYAEEMVESLKSKGYNDVFIDVFVKR